MLSEPTRARCPARTAETLTPLSVKSREHPTPLAQGRQPQALSTAHELLPRQKPLYNTTANAARPKAPNDCAQLHRAPPASRPLACGHHRPNLPHSSSALMLFDQRRPRRKDRRIRPKKSTDHRPPSPCNQPAATVTSPTHEQTAPHARGDSSCFERTKNWPRFSYAAHSASSDQYRPSETPSHTGISTSVRRHRRSLATPTKRLVSPDTHTRRKQSAPQHHPTCLPPPSPLYSLPVAGSHHRPSPPSPSAIEGAAPAQETPQALRSQHVSQQRKWR